jgi:hypothetical protein
MEKLQKLYLFYFIHLVFAEAARLIYVRDVPTNRALHLFHPLRTIPAGMSVRATEFMGRTSFDH